MSERKSAEVEVDGAIREVIRDNLKGLEPSKIQLLIDCHSFDELVVKVVELGSDLYKDIPVPTLRDHIEFIKASKVSHRASTRYLLGYLKGTADTLENVQKYEIGQIAKLTS